MPPKTYEWLTGDPEWTMKITVPQAPGELPGRWDDRFEDIKAAALDAFPEN